MSEFTALVERVEGAVGSGGRSSASRRAVRSSTSTEPSRTSPRRWSCWTQPDDAKWFDRRGRTRRRDSRPIGAALRCRCPRVAVPGSGSTTSSERSCRASQPMVPQMKSYRSGRPTDDALSFRPIGMRGGTAPVLEAGWWFGCTEPTDRHPANWTGAGWLAAVGRKDARVLRAQRARWDLFGHSESDRARRACALRARCALSTRHETGCGSLPSWCAGSSRRSTPPPRMLQQVPRPFIVSSGGKRSGLTWQRPCRYAAVSL